MVMINTESAFLVLWWTDRLVYVSYVTVTADKLQMADDDQVPMPSAPPSTTMDFIQGYEGLPMNDGTQEHTCLFCWVCYVVCKMPGFHYQFRCAQLLFCLAIGRAFGL